nr:uncharacterized protein LOC108080758 [Drosophila kikkawai]
MLRQTMSSTSGSTRDWKAGSLGESLGDQDCIVIGEVPKRPKRPTVLSSGEDTGRSVKSKSSRRSSDIQDQDAVACYTTKVKKKASQTNFFPEVEAQSQHSREGSASEEYAPNDMEYISSEQDEMQTRSQPSQRSTDHSKSFSQIYSEIYEESIERQQKAEQACRAYNINRSKLRGTRKRSDSRGRESGTYSSLESSYSSDLGKRSEEFGSQSNVEEFNCKAISEGQLTQTVGYRKITPIRSCFKRLPSSQTVNDMDSFRERSERSNKKLQPKKYYDEYSTNTYGQRSSLSLRESSVCIQSSVYSKPRKYQREGSNTEETNDHDYLTDCKSVSGIGNPTSVTSSSRTQRDYHSRSSTRHSHHHYRRLESVPKTYQDRGNSPINIKTRRQTIESRNVYTDMDTEEERDVSFRKSNISVGVQYPSDDEEGEEYRSNMSDISYPKSGGRSYCKESSVLSFTQLVRNVYDEDREMTDRSGSRIVSRGLGVTSDEEGPSQPSEYTFDDGHTNPCEEFTDVCSEDPEIHLEEEPYDKQDVGDRNVSPSEPDQVDGEIVEELSEDQILSSEEEPALSSTHLASHEMSDVESKPITDNLKTKSKNGLGLRIYNADEALMEIPEGFQGDAIILDDDADFLDITLTDDEEHIRAKLMAAALTTRTSNPSSSVNTSRKSRRSIDSTSSILSYKPSVIFSRRSEVEEKSPRTDRVSLLAERVFRACANPYTEPSNWQPSATPKSNWQPMEESKYSKLTASILDDRENTLNGALQLLTQDFNRKLQRQLKEIAQSFH